MLYLCLHGGERRTTVKRASARGIYGTCGTHPSKEPCDDVLLRLDNMAFVCGMKDLIYI